MGAGFDGLCYCLFRAGRGGATWYYNLISLIGGASEPGFSGETEEVEGSKGDRVDLRDATQAIAALLWQAGENHSVDNLWQGREAYVGDGLPPVPPKIVERIHKGSTLKCVSCYWNSGWLQERGRNQLHKGQLKAGGGGETRMYMFGCSVLLSMWLLCLQDGPSESSR